MTKYKDDFTIVEAFKMGVDSMPDWFMDKVTDKSIMTYSLGLDGDPFTFRQTHCYIKTKKGVMKGGYKDYIVKDVDGEIYPYSPKKFKKKYNEV